ncbi:hypothetical protein, partial [Rhizobium ruizarguesonis]|uniref:hypothetical protein n=1 Tax=Rhizobium ruizarguesonis TaxID=2081791 RepID=UPI001A9012E3
KHLMILIVAFLALYGLHTRKASIFQAPPQNAAATLDAPDHFCAQRSKRSPQRRARHTKGRISADAGEPALSRIMRHRQNSEMPAAGLTKGEAAARYRGRGRLT